MTTFLNSKHSKLADIFCYGLVSGETKRNLKMKRTSLLVAVSCFIVALCAVSVPVTRDDQSNQATELTFSEPVEIPGVVLPAGTYWFTIMADDPE